MGVLIMLNNFFHDLSVALLIASLAGAILVNRSTVSGIETLRPALLRLYHRLLIGSLIGIAAFGAVRAITFKEFEWVNALGHQQVIALVVKHVILVGATLAGITYLLLLWKKGRS